MLTLDAARELILRTIERAAPTAVPLDDALGRIVAEDIRSDVDSPPFDKSLMDGFAVRACDVATGTAELRILERILAGMLPTMPVGPGEATQIMTGAPLPAGVDAVVRIEDCELAGDTVRISVAGLRPGTSIIRQGTNLKAGAVVLAAGTRLQPAHIGTAAEIGRSHLLVFPRPTVAVLATGDELVPIDHTPGPGQIRNSNEAMLMAQIAAAGGMPVPLGIARDQRVELRAGIERGLLCDVLVLSGGVSAGAADLVPSELAAAGVRQVFHKVELKPGKPIWFGVQARAEGGRCYVFGLPGNPVSSLVCFELFVKLALRILQDRSPAIPEAVDARLTHAHQQPNDRPTMHLAQLTHTTTGPEVSLVPWHGSSDLAATIHANAMAFLSGEPRDYQPGDLLPTTPWRD